MPPLNLQREIMPNIVTDVNLNSKFSEKFTSVGHCSERNGDRSLDKYLFYFQSTLSITAGRFYSVLLRSASYSQLFR